MSVDIKIDTSQVKELVKKFESIGSQGIEFFNLLGIKIDQMTQLTFRMLGARSGMPKWRGYSLLTQHPSWKANDSKYPSYKGKHYNPDRWNRRRGTDNAKGRRYSEGSKLLQASGGFRQSFKINKATNKSLTYGTNHNIAKEIIGDRPVLFFTDSDSSIVGKMFLRFIKEKLK